MPIPARIPQFIYRTFTPKYTDSNSHSIQISSVYTTISTQIAVIFKTTYLSTNFEFVCGKRQNIFSIVNIFDTFSELQMVDMTESFEYEFCFISIPGIGFIERFLRVSIMPIIETEISYYNH